ncbi:DNA topoisomerase IV, alpha subunit [Hanseniaspora valbyensis NRRL Y-1626]|uniref:DNA topoisomerase (ATP-hydrolyzing) n=1 Tax=Hanseniaspora valbyensis NRRL Y-1626 TaxID=766949 RepID=A0A1B7TFZ0_9ASCO|nr:DNA topoisomerase IV, alpha subunit [Hanseniaspora valbyensis NRRL Y-1626]
MNQYSEQSEIFFSSGLPNFNKILKHKTNISRKNVIEQLEFIATKRKQIIYIDKFSKDLYDTSRNYIDTKLDFILQAVKQGIAFEIRFQKNSNKGKTTVYGLPLANCDKKERDKTTNTLMFINILQEISDIARNNKLVVLRDIYYKNVSIYNNKQVNFNYLIEKLSLISGIQRNSLNVAASQKGEYYTFSKITMSSTNNMNCPQVILNKGKNLIPTCFNVNYKDYDCISGETTPTQVLIVEKDSVFSDIVNNINPCLLQNWITVSGRGQPDILSKNFVKMLSNCKNIKKILVLTDLDPYGIYIALNYMSSIFQTILLESKMTKPKVEYLGVKILDLLMEKQLVTKNTDNYKDNKNFLHYTSKDYKISTNAIKKISSSPFFQKQEAIKNLLYECQRQMFFGFKAELNSLKGGNFSSWIEEKINIYT